MAKTKEQTENGKEKAKAGTSLNARAKAAILSLAVTLKELSEQLTGANIVIPEMSEVLELGAEFAAKGVKGLPLKTQLENTVARMRDILQTSVVDGIVQMSDETENEYNDLAAKAKRLRAAIDKENKPEETESNTLETN